MIEPLPGDVSGQRKVRKLLDAYRTAKAYDTAISQVVTSLREVDQSVVIANSDGLFTNDRRVYTRLGVQAIASGNGENQTGFIGPGAMMGFELFDTRVDPAVCGTIAAETAVKMLRAPVCPAGVMPVVIDSGFGGVIFHEACGHSLEATAVARGNSEFAGKLGQKIAADCVTAIDDGTMPNEWGSLNIDDEGTPTTRLTLIENGVLKNYMIDRLNGRRMNMPVTGSARRQSYAYRAHFAHDEHLHRARQRIRPGRDNRYDGRRPVCGQDGRRLGQPLDRRIQLRRNGGLSCQGRQNFHARARRDAGWQGLGNHHEDRPRKPRYEDGSGHVRLRKRLHTHKRRSAYDTRQQFDRGRTLTGGKHGTE